MNTPTIRAVAFAAACIAAGPASAAATASATFGPLAIELTDLDLSDGITPSIAFWYVSATDPLANRLHVVAMQTDPWAIQDFVSWGLTPWTPGSLDASAGAAQAHADITGSGDAVGTVLRASGSASDFTSSIDGAYAGFQSDAIAPQSWGTGFTLSANTRLTVSGLATISGAASWTGHGAGWDEQAAASVRMDIKALDDSQVSFDEIEHHDWATAGQPTFDFSESRMLSVSFENLTNGDQDGSLVNIARANGQTYATLGPVPEPGTLGLLAAGLAATGGLVRRRRRNR